MEVMKGEDGNVDRVEGNEDRSGAVLTHYRGTEKLISTHISYVQTLAADGGG